ncbi:hypothetical protein [Litorihabitans aurantiacus]|uniref:Excreted virulence factor EspC, type VII ESX diderm n=1 Tax=Litorihabitans aurantiacus TaxID=1930061 RepID=A0AA38CT58_9MICO|nr:hypothetical protein [Litorihabitans aurantiacus]GMA32696.1 hypothetical protein GCM10025875_26880 [Litorihabitans aurantiacus]
MADEDIDVDLADLRTIANGLSDGAEALEGLSFPDGPDAGLVTPSITSLLGQLATSTGNVASSMAAASENVELSRSYYQRSDADESASFSEIERVMEPS